MFLPAGIGHSLYELNTLKSSVSTSFEESLSNLGIDSEAYVRPHEIEANAGKNVIILSLESLEHSFLYDNLSHLTPNLNALSQEFSIYPMTQLDGGNWTQGSLYTFMTGVPFFSNASNENLFVGAQQSYLTSISHVFDAANYSQRYIMGKPEFGSTDQLINMLGIELISEKNVTDSYPLSPWGLHDKDLFNEIKKSLAFFKGEKKPFVLYASTVSTHGPDGIYDERMNQWVEPQAGNLEFTVKSLDYLIGDLMQFLKSESLLENTVFYIFPDHKLMGNTFNVGNQFQEPRELFLLTNGEGQGARSKEKNRSLCQIDLPKIILEGAGIKHNASFLSDYIEDDPPVFLAKNRQSILSLNESAIKLNTFGGDLLLYLDGDEELVLKSGKNRIIIPGIDHKAQKAAMISFDEKMRPSFELRQANIAYTNPLEEPHIFICRKGKRLYAYYRVGNQNLTYEEGLGQVLIPAKLHAKAKKALAFQNTLFKEVPKDLTEIALVANDKVRLVSSSHWSPERLHPSSVMAGKQLMPAFRGVNLLTKNEIGLYRLQNFDTYQESQTVSSLIKAIDSLQKQKAFFALVADISVGEYVKQDAETFTQLGLPVLAQLEPNKAYIAYADHGFISEMEDERVLSLSFPFNDAPRKRSSEQIEKNGADKMRFIAHAGGSINGELYTNSLEALDTNYAKGFRLFELDIVITKDKFFVAAHDWNTWKSQSGYKGALPPTLAQFKQYKINNQYQSLDLEDINQWFIEHADAILVTDKINDPETFAPQFVDKNRLMMELFSEASVLKAQAMGIRSAMPSMNVIYNHKGDRLAYL
ncbi:MAG: sulfatase-like hydrolase/transferase, partial [Bacteroidia bacterium]